MKTVRWFFVFKKIQDAIEGSRSGRHISADMTTEDETDARRRRRGANGDTWTYALDASFAHAKNLTAALSAVKLSKRQRARVRADARGVTFTAMDESKCCVASANFRAETFAAYACDETGAMAGMRGGDSTSVAFDVNLGALIDVLGAFASRDGEAEVRMRWPNREGLLTLELESSRAGVDRDLRQCVYAAISPEAVPEGEERSDESSFRGETNAFMLPTSTLKEIVDDLEWPCADVVIDVEADALRFSASGPEIGDLTVDVDTSEGKLTEFTCREPAAFAYKYRFLKSATAVGGNFLGGGGGGGGGGDEAVTMTRVAVSDTGFLKIVHLLHLSKSQVAFGSGGLNAFMVPVTFIVNPVEAEEASEDEQE